MNGRPIIVAFPRCHLPQSESGNCGHCVDFSPFGEFREILKVRLRHHDGSASQFSVSTDLQLLSPGANFARPRAIHELLSGGIVMR